jgi:glycosyltransferase involved in cell wall biosynthesis
MINNRTDPFSLSCIVPAFNEEAVLRQFLPQLHSELAKFSPQVEIIVIDDGSGDNTLSVATELAESLGMTVLGFSRNFGKEAAITAGLEQARGDLVLIIDADMQEPVSLIGEMIERWRQGYDMVFAVRDSREDEHLLKRLGVGLFYTLMGASNQLPITPHARDFRLMDRKVVDALNLFPERTRFMKGLFSWVGFKSCALPVRILPRASGVSGFGFSRLVSLAMTGVTSFSKVPLRLWGSLGFIISLLAFTYGSLIVLRTIMFGVDLPGFATIVVSIMFFSGLQLLSVGILGEYLGRVFDEVKRRPIYLVAKKTDHSPLNIPKNL